MATENIFIIDPDNAAGTDYTSLQAFALDNYDLQAADEIAVAECRSSSGTADTTAGISFTAGWNTDATRYIEIRNHSSEPTNGYWDTSRYRLDWTITLSYSLSFSPGFYRVKGIQLSVNGGTTAGTLLRTYTATSMDSEIIIDSCIFNGAPSLRASNGIRFDNEGAGYTFKNVVRNCIFYEMSAYGITDQSGTGTNNWYITNNTIINSGNTGLFISDSDKIGKIYNNVISGSVTNDFNITAGFDADYNISSDATATGTNSITSATVTFEDEANDIYLLDKSDTTAKGEGYNLYNEVNYPFNYDILQNTRKTTTWDIGAHQVSLYSSYHMII